MDVFKALGEISDVAFSLLAVTVAIRFIRARSDEIAARHAQDLGTRKLRIAMAKTKYALAAFQHPWLVWLALLAALLKLVSILIPAILSWLTYSN